MKNLFLFAFLAMIFLGSCTDDLIMDKNSQFNSTDISTREKGGDDKDDGPQKPTIIEDLMVFDDVEHFKSYYLFLSSLYDNNEELFDQEVANFAGFPSIYNRFENQEFTSFDEYFKPFINDPIMSVFTNENYEIGVGDVLITQMNNDYLAATAMDNSEGRQGLQALPKGGDIDLDVIPQDVFIGKDTDPEILSRGFGCNCSIEIELIDCNTVEISGRCKNWIFKSGDAKIFVALTNNASQPNWQFANVTTVNGNYSITLDISNFTNGIYVHVLADPDCHGGSTNYERKEMTPGDASCDHTDKSTGWLWAENSGQAFSHRTASYKNFWASYEEAKIYSYAWSPNGFKKNKANLKVTIDAVRRGYTCGEYGPEDETKSCGNCNNKRARVNYIGYGDTHNLNHCTGDVTGSFRKIKSTIFMTANGVVEYDCCL